MTLTHILIFAALSVPYLILLPKAARQWALFVGSIIAIYWLQPDTRIDALDFIFPTATLALVMLCWRLSRQPDQNWTREDRLAAGIIAALVIILSLGRYLIPIQWFTPSRPSPLLAGAAIILVAALLGIGSRIKQQQRFMLPAILLIIALLVILKTEPFAKEAARLLRQQMGQPTNLARATELEWLGFSYVAFRLIHTLRDRQTGKLPRLSLREYTTYVIFFPSFTAGPIDRAERFLPDLQNLPGPEPSRLVQAAGRITVGIAKKFIIADSLAYFALSASKADQASSTGALWIMLYAYTFQIYFDFSGYSDIAIGIGQLFGIKLPENFNQPYLKRNITLFWQSWHITLSNWVRFYVFSPLTRTLLARKRKPSPTVLALIGQMATMIVIGLWHGVTWHFVVWGIWHALGLFIHKVYSDRTRMQYIQMRSQPRRMQTIGVIGTLLTFQFVALGWVWFALPTLHSSWDVFLRLFGL